MTIRIASSCVGCSACIPVCPENALDMGPENRVEVDAAKCTDCGKCVSSCPVEALSLPKGTPSSPAQESAVSTAVAEPSQEAPPTPQIDPSSNTVWVYVEHMGGKIAGVTIELIGAATQLAQKLKTRVGVVLPGDQVEYMVPLLIEAGADVVYLIDHPVFHFYRTESYMQAVCYLVRKYKPEVFLMGATTTGRDLAGAVATELQTGLTADCTMLDIDLEKRMLLASRPAFGGNIMATILCERHRPQMASVRPKVMQALTPVPNRKGELIRESIDIPEESIPKQVLDIVCDLTENVRLDEAKIIVSGGRGVKEAKGFQMLQELADVLGGVVAGSRGAVEAGSIDAKRQVGQTGQTVGPKIYFAIGISGAIQHVVGMQHSDVIVAINTNPDCTMMKMATYAIVGDAATLVPKISAAFRAALAEKPSKEEPVVCHV